MPRKRTKVVRLTTKQVARLLGIHHLTLYQMLRDGRIPEPPRNPANNYRVWTPQFVEQIKQEMGAR
jgi:hypothetical protein